MKNNYKSPEIFLKTALAVVTSIFFILSIQAYAGQMKKSASEPQSDSMLVLNSIERYSLSKNLEYLEDVSGELSIDMVRSENTENLWLKSGMDLPVFGLKNTIYWFRLKIKNEHKNNESWLLEIRNPILHEMELYRPAPDHSYSMVKSGIIYPFKSREYDNINFVFKLDIPTYDEAYVYFRVKSHGLIILPLNLYSPKDYMGVKNSEYNAHFLFNGMLLITILYNLFISISIRRRLHFYFLCYIVSFSIMQNQYSGILSQFLFPEFSFFSTNVFPFLIDLTALLLLLFSLSFLDLRKTMPKLYRLSMPLFLILGIHMTISLFTGFASSILSAVSLAAA
ncbi:MAG: hypothetical protein HQK54_17165 [Oligoflexales bacterium]|nr:hypothetical protein [Oligoflexales bacterium]